MKGWLSLLAISTLLIGFWLAQRPAEPPAADGLELQRADGGLIRLSELSDRPLLIDFWSPSCPPCLAELPELAAIQQEFAGHGLTVLGIAQAHDRPDAVAEVSRERGIPYPVALDLEGLAARRFMVEVVPTRVLLLPGVGIVHRSSGAQPAGRLTALVKSFLEG